MSAHQHVRRFNLAAERHLWEQRPGCVITIDPCIAVNNDVRISEVVSSSVAQIDQTTAFATQRSTRVQILNLFVATRELSAVQRLEKLNRPER